MIERLDFCYTTDCPVSTSSFLSSNMAGRLERILYNRICVQHNFSCARSPDDTLPLEPQMLFGILGHVDITGKDVQWKF